VVEIGSAANLLADHRKVLRFAQEDKKSRRNAMCDGPATIVASAMGVIPSVARILSSAADRSLATLG
jgi:hypothetical protein